MKNTKKMMSLVSLFVVLAVPSYAQRIGGFTIPKMPTIPRMPSVPRIPSVPRSTPSVHIPRSAPSTTPHVTQTQPRSAQSTGQRSTGSTAQSRPESTPSRPQATPREPASARKAAQNQQKAQARQQNEQQKQQQKQQKEQARQQKEQKKQQQKQQKEEARHQKELQKQQKNSKRATSSAKEAKSALHSAVAPAGGSKAQVQQLNSNRSNMSGINRKPLPSGELTVHPNGRMTLKAEGGRQYGLRPNGTVASYSDREKTVSFDQRGKVSSIHTANMDVHNGPHGRRTVINRRADGSKVVSTGRHSGYVERNVVMNNRTYIQRTTLINQHVYTRTFIANGFGGRALVPPVFFAPGFYGWAYHPWAAPIHFAWGWFGAPWYAGPYFVAAPVYPSAAFWLTDYMIGETLSAAYQLHHDAADRVADEMVDEMADDMSAEDNTVADAANAGDSDGNANMSAETLHADAATPITPELKSAIAEEVKQQLANDNAEARNPGQASFDMLPGALSTPNHVFVVSSDLDVTTTDQQLCNLQAGDMLQLTSPAASDSSFVQLRVASSKRMDCPGGVLVNVSLPDLQEMQNSFQAHIEAGLGALRNSHGRDGLPTAPPAALAAPPQPAVSGLTPVSGPESSTLLDQERDQADQAQAKAELGSL